MFIRFTLPYIHVHTNRPVGVFRGAYWVYQDGRLSEGHVAWLFEEMTWFNGNLPVPLVPVDPRACSGSGPRVRSH